MKKRLCTCFIINRIFIHVNLLFRGLLEQALELYGTLIGQSERVFALYLVMYKRYVINALWFNFPAQLSDTYGNSVVIHVHVLANL